MILIVYTHDINMTIEVNKSLTGNTSFIFTITEGNTGTTTSGLTLSLQNLYDNTNSQISLPSDSSPYPARYNKYSLPITTFSGYSEGKYEYSIDQSGSTIETGILNITSYTGSSTTEWTSQYKSLPTTEVDDDYIVYNG